MGNAYTINYDKIYTLDEVYDLLKLANKKTYIGFGENKITWSTGNDFATTMLYDLNTCDPKFLKIFICRDFCEEDAYDEEHKSEISEDYILSHGKYQYYVAEICIRQTGSFASVANVIWNILEDVMSFSCNIVKYHKNYPNCKQYCILDHITPDRNKRCDNNNEYVGMAYDLYEIFNEIRTVTFETICSKVIKSLKDKSYYTKIENLNKDMDYFYENNLPIPETTKLD
jgi:hypothetical protein